MTLEVPTLSLPPTHPSGGFDAENERQTRRVLEQAINRIAQSASSSSLPWFDIRDYGAQKAVAADQSAAIQAAATAADAAGGGVLFIPAGAFRMDTDVNVQRTVWVTGQGPGLSRLVSTSGAKFKIKGLSPTVDESYVVQGLTFDGVQLRCGDTSADLGESIIVAFCHFVNCTINPALYYGYTCFNTSVIGCRFRLNTTHVYFDFATVVAGSGAGMTFSDSVLSECTNAFYINGVCTDGFQINVVNCEFDHFRRVVKSVSSGDGVVTLTNVNFELAGYNENASYDANDGFFIENDGPNVFLDGFWALSGTETGWFYNKSGQILVGAGRGTWNADHFAKVTGGTIIVDQSRLWANNRCWGQDEQRMKVSGSSGSTAKIMAPRTAYVGYSNYDIGTMTNASPNATAIPSGEAYDYNDREWFFSVKSLADGTDNTLRIEYQDGTHTQRVDLAFPNVVGGGLFRLIWARGGFFNCTGVYAPTGAAGNALAIRTETSLVADYTVARLLQFSTIKAGATAATIDVDSLREYISGPHINPGI